MPGGDAGRDLYGLVPGEFTAARNALAKQLKTAGDKDEAALVAKLRKPPTTAWALNKVAREQPGVIDAVLDAGAGLRAATENVLAGDASGLRTAQAWERRSVDAATSAGAAALTAAGQGAGDAARQRMAATVRAAMVDGDVANALRDGVLDDDRDAPGFGLDAFSPAVAGSAARRRASAPPPTKPAPAGQAEEEPPVPDDATEGVADATRAQAEARAAAEAEAAVAAEWSVDLARRAEQMEAAAEVARAAAEGARTQAVRAAAQADERDHAARQATTSALSARAEADAAATAAKAARNAVPPVSA